MLSKDVIDLVALTVLFRAFVNSLLCAAPVHVLSKSVIVGLMVCSISAGLCNEHVLRA